MTNKNRRKQLNDSVNESIKLEANTCNQRQARESQRGKTRRENACEQVTIDFSSTSDWLRSDASFFYQITENDKAKPKQTSISFDTQWKLLYIGQISITKENWIKHWDGKVLIMQLLWLSLKVSSREKHINVCKTLVGRMNTRWCVWTPQHWFKDKLINCWREIKPVSILASFFNYVGFCISKPEFGVWMSVKHTLSKCQQYDTPDCKALRSFTTFFSFLTLSLQTFKSLLALWMHLRKD